ncbi:unnamed protein product [Prunus armeniaca]|uniref:Uncharacterized protein n=1 Tax=Prunus armeniaca TaxID=36596 RepID=A0A6J5TU98_PRUAR|nr:unnamed protein product [Prunus armeniaca]
MARSDKEGEGGEKKWTPLALVIESLRRDLLNVLNSVEFSNPSESAEDVLIYNNANNHPSISVHEIGLGAILLKPPTSPADIRASGQGS